MKIGILCFFIILSFGNQIEFTFNNTNKVLTISGNGIVKQIDNYLYNLYQEETKEIIIENGIIEISNGIFYNWNNLKKITISKSIKSIGNYCFANCEELESVIFEENSQIEIINDDKRPIFVAVDNNDKVLGYAFCVYQQYIDNNILTDIKTLYIDDLCVDEKCRREHIGTKLLDYAFNYAKQIDCYNVNLNVWNLNQDAMDFYKKSGMEPLKTCMEKIIK